MPEKVECEDCGEQFDPRGLSAHKRMAHDGDSDPDADGEDEVVRFEKDEIDMPAEEIEDALPAANVTDDAITFRTIQEIEVADEGMKRELLEELKEYIRGGTLRV